MNHEPEIQSEAFRRATLQSERFRVTGMLIVLGGTVLLLLIRALFSVNPHEAQLLPKAILFGAVAAAYEGVVFRRVNGKIREGQDFPHWFWGMNLFIETLIPTGFLFSLDREPLLWSLSGVGCSRGVDLLSVYDSVNPKTQPSPFPAHGRLFSGWLPLSCSLYFLELPKHWE